MSTAGTASDNASSAPVMTWACSGLIAPDASAARVASCSASDPASATCLPAAPALIPSARSHAAVDVAPVTRRADDRRSASATTAS